ncbi:MAG: hypothetical protein H5T62_17300 [Anaerolineae bacterium]|nr:hypothetical protein [Anaerolineae bacterium]
MIRLRNLWLWLVVCVITGCTFSPLPTVVLQTVIPLPASVQLDTTGAEALLEFCQALEQGHPWDEAAIRRIVVSPPYQTLIAHHSRMDTSITTEAFIELLLALRDGQQFTSNSERLTRIHAAYRSACEQVSTLQTRLECLVDPILIERGSKRAREALPPQARLEATVYFLPDGRSFGYVVDNAIVLDLLQVSSAGEIEKTLAHELHHVGVSSLLPEPCPDPELDAALETLVGMVQEGAATYWVDEWRASPTPADFALVEAFLRDALSGQLEAEEATRRRAELVQGWRGPLYQVGNEMIAVLVAAQGDDWVQAHLGDPVGLLRAWQEEAEPEFAFDQAIFQLLDEAKAHGMCSTWFRD